MECSSKGDRKEHSNNYYLLDVNDYACVSHNKIQDRYSILCVSELCANEEGNNCFKGNFGNSVVVVERAL